MNPFFFVDNSEKLLSKYHSMENLIFLDTITLLFHQIFLYRLQDIELDISLYNKPEIKNTDNWNESYQMTIFTCYQNIINTVLSDSILKDHFSLFNSYHKIWWDSFIRLATYKVSDFSIIDFYELLEQQDKSNLSALSMRLMADFWLTETYISYMSMKYKKTNI